MIGRAAAAALALGAALGACGGGGARDVVPASRDVRGEAAAASAAPAGLDGYVYVAKRRHGVVALAEARGVSAETARRAVDRIADELEACAAKLEAEGKLAPDGAGRVVAAIGDDGAVRGVNIKAAPGGVVAANLLVCVVAPVRTLTFPAQGGGARGLAIEATWGAAP
jgi:hypothetical protein